MPSSPRSRQWIQVCYKRIITFTDQINHGFCDPLPTQTAFIFIFYFQGARCKESPQRSFINDIFSFPGGAKNKPIRCIHMRDSPFVSFELRFEELIPGMPSGEVLFPVITPCAQKLPSTLTRRFYQFNASRFSAPLILEISVIQMEVSYNMSTFVLPKFIVYHGGSTAADFSRPTYGNGERLSISTCISFADTDHTYDGNLLAATRQSVRLGRRRPQEHITWASISYKSTSTYSLPSLRKPLISSS